MSKIMRNGVAYGTGGGGGSSWIESVPEMHRNIFRGQSLGSSVSSAQYAAIQNGSFTSMYVGDYWTIPTIINGNSVDITYRIADMNYWKNTQNNESIPNHLVIVPDNSFYTSTMFSSSYDDYTTSDMYTTNIVAARTAISTVFGDHLLTHKTQLSTSDTVYHDSTVDLMSLLMVLGYISPAVYEALVRTVDHRQLSLFRLNPLFIDKEFTNDGYWTRDVCYDHKAGQIYHGRVGMGTSSEFRGVRPVFAIGTANT